MNRSTWGRRLLLFFVIGPIAILVFGGIVMWLWNNALSPALNVSTITFWQGLGILVLSKILFGSFGGGRGYRRDYGKQRMMWNQMTPEQREKFKEEWRSRCGKWGNRSWRSQESAVGSRESTP